ncbi:NAD-dependent succinate-semialdehyde dehydrogenase [Arthrobacter sp. MDB2-24]
MPYKTVNPATGETVQEFTSLTDDQILDAVDRSAAAYRLWNRTPLEERVALLRRLADLYQDGEEELARIITEEMGKPIRQARGEIQIVRDIYRYYADNAQTLLKPEKLTSSLGGQAEVVLQSTGSILGIMPWNYPFYQVARLVAPNLLLGNTILLKHASNVPQAALIQERLIHDAGFPKDVYINLLASGKQVSTLVVPAPSVEGVSLTGSEPAGAAVAEIAGRHLKKVVLELGGSDPFIVLDGHDLQRTVTKAVSGRVGNAGQACTASKRFIVVEDVHDDFLTSFSDAMAGITPADPADPATVLGPLSSVEARTDVMEIVEDAVSKGATLAAGGHIIDGAGAYMEATVLTDVTPDMRAYAEEIFGPVAVVYKVKDADHAVELANSSPYGLGGSVFSADLEQARRVATQLESGMVFVNEVTESAPDLPFGGVKRSGVGRELGKYGLEEFANKKLIHLPA